MKAVFLAVFVLVLSTSIGPTLAARHLLQTSPTNTTTTAPATQRRVLLYIWTGADKDTAKDFIITMDVTHPADPDFGKILSNVDAPWANLEPHHVGLSADGSVFAAGSFTAHLLNPPAPALLFFDVATDPTTPRFIKGLTPTHGAVADDWVRLPGGGFLVSLMGSSSGGTPGRIGEVSPDLELVGEHLPDTAQDTFNPHGLWALPGADRFVSVDYADFSTMLKPHVHTTDTKYRTTVRVWQLSTRKQLKVIDLGAGNAKGIMDVMAVGTKGTEVLHGSGTNYLWALDTLTYRHERVVNLSGRYNRSASTKQDSHCVLSAPFANNTRVFATLFADHRLLLLNVSDPFNATVLQDYKIKEGAGPHAVAVHPDSNLVTVTDYYLQIDNRHIHTPLDYSQDRKIRFFTIAPDFNSFAPAPTPWLDLHRLYHKTPKQGARPHGVFFKVAHLPAAA